MREDLWESAIPRRRVRGSVLHAIHAIHTKLQWWMTRAKDTARDGFHGVDTCAVVPERILQTSDGHQARSDRYDYDPTPWRALPRVLRFLALPAEGFTFVDFGCGKGRILLSALAHPFARVVGVEFSPHLCLIAEKNLSAARFFRRRCSEARVICADAVSYPIPDGPAMFFFYNPFSYTVMETVLTNIVNSYLYSHRTIYLIFYATSSQIPLISQFLKRKSDAIIQERVRMLVGKRSVYVFELPQRD